MEALPAGMVTLPETGTQLTPLKNSSAVAAAVSVPRMAVPDVSAGVKTTGVVLRLDRLTVKTAGAPSATVTLAIDRAGVSLSEPPVPEPSSVMVPTPMASAIAEPADALDRLTVKASLPS